MQTARTRVIVLTGLMAVLLPAGSVDAEPGTPWPIEVAGFEAPEPGEHPRLLFRRDDLPALRARAATPEGRAILQRLLVQLGGGESVAAGFSPARQAYDRQNEQAVADLPVGAYTISHAAGFGFLWQITGERRYLDLGVAAFDKGLEGVRDRDDRYSFRQPGGALRAGPTLGWYALAYDLLYDGLDAATRQRLAGAILNYNEGRHASLAELVRGSRHMPASNHWGMQVGGGALAALALMNDPEADQAKLGKLLADSRKAMARNLTEGFGDHGWFAEGDGAGVMSSHIVFGTALQAWRVAGGLDFASTRPNGRWPFLKFVLLTLPGPLDKDDKPPFPSRGAYPHNVWARTGMSGPGTFVVGFGVVNDQEKPALLWLYNRTWRDIDQRQATPFETASPYPHRAILAFINWPFDLAERNPGEAIPRAILDRRFGFAAFRNRFQDANDTLITVQLLATRGWHKADKGVGDIWIWSGGQRDAWRRIWGQPTHFTPGRDGSGILATRDGTCLAVDFSGASGAEALLVLSGIGASEAGSSDAAFDLAGTPVALRFIGRPAGEPVLDKDAITVGEQTIALRDGLLTLSRFTPDDGRER